MHVTVDLAKCQDHGQCAIAAPAVFWRTDAATLQSHGIPADPPRSYVEDAADVCPAQAISIKE